MRRAILALTALAILSGTARSATPDPRATEAERRRREAARRLIEGSAAFRQFWQAGATAWQGAVGKQFAMPTDGMAAVTDPGDKADEIAGHIAKFKDAPVAERMAARNALVKIGALAVKPLCESLQSTETSVRSSAETVLAKIGSPCLAAVLPLTDSKDRNVRAAAVRIVQKTADGKALGAIVARIESSTDKKTKLGLVSAIKSRKVIGPKDVDIVLGLLAGARDVEIRRAMAGAAVRSGDMRALPTFYNMAKSSDKLVAQFGVAGVQSLTARCTKAHVAMLYAAYSGTTGNLQRVLARALQTKSGRNPAGEPARDWKFFVFVRLTNADWPPRAR